MVVVNWSVITVIFYQGRGYRQTVVPVILLVHTMVMPLLHTYRHDTLTWSLAGIASHFSVIDLYVVQNIFLGRIQHAKCILSITASTLIRSYKYTNRRCLWGYLVPVAQLLFQNQSVKTHLKCGHHLYSDTMYTSINEDCLAKQI